MNPKGEGGAIPGMLAPLQAVTKADLDYPMERGIYAMASVDQKTMLKLMVMPRDEAGFAPEPFLQSDKGLQTQEEVRNRIAATWHVMQLTFEAFDPATFPALDFFLLAARRLADLTEGVVADPICQRYLLPSEVIKVPRTSPEFDVSEHIKVVSGEVTHTLGLMKFALPELSIGSSHPLAETFLLRLCDRILHGKILSAGERVGPFLVTSGGKDTARWEGIPVFDLNPPPGQSTDEALDQWRQSHES